MKKAIPMRFTEAVSGGIFQKTVPYAGETRHTGCLQFKKRRENPIHHGTSTQIAAAGRGVVRPEKFRHIHPAVPDRRSDGRHHLSGTRHHHRLRVAAARRIYDRADVILLVVPVGQWGEEEEGILRAAAERKIRVIPVVTFADQTPPDEAFLTMLREKTGLIPLLSDPDRDRLLTELRTRLLEAAPDDFVEPPPLLADLVGAGDTVLLIVPIDKQAPKGRLILPQVQTIRDALDLGALPLACRETEYRTALARLRTPPEVPCTTFSILFSRLKGDLAAYAEGARTIRRLRPGDRVLVAEGCTHHATNDDIGRVKIPRWLAEKAGGALQISVCAGRDYPADVSEYRLIVHCGGCMLNRRETLRRIELARAAGVPITNYGMAISECRGVFDRVMSPFDRR